MNNNTKQKVFLNGKEIITDWRNIRIASPDNLQNKTRANESAIKEISKQKTQVNNISATAIY